MSRRFKFRLSVPVMAVNCLPLVIGAFIAWDVHRSHRSASATLALNVRSVRAAEELAIGIRDLRAHLDRFLLTADCGQLKQVSTLQNMMDRWLADARGAAVTPPEQALITRLDAGYTRLFAGIGQLERVNAASRPAAVRELMHQADDVLLPTQDYLDYNEEEIEASSVANQRSVDRMVVGLLLLGVCGPVSGLLAGYGIAHAINRSVVRLSVPVVDAAGTLSQVVGPVTLSASPGLDELEDALHRLAEQAGAVVERLRLSEREALRAEQLAALGQMAAGFAHEVRNPLMSIKLLIQSSARKRAALAGRGLAVLEEEIARLESLTSTFLDFARPPLPKKQPFDARALLEATAELVAGRAVQRDVKIDCDVPTEAIWVEIDADQVRQVILNLLLNALDAVGDGGKIRVWAAFTGKGRGDGVEIGVEDSGPGLSAGLGQDIFAPFVSTKTTGIGLGLCVCKRIAEAHGGEVVASDRPEGGAVFTLRLPGSCVASVVPLWVA